MDLERLLVCPLSKQPLERDGADHVAPAGFVYRDGDFRVPLDFAPGWTEGQAEMEAATAEWLHEHNSMPARMAETDDDTREVYEQIPLTGAVLDVAGWIGLVVAQAGLDPRRYVGLDTMRVDFAKLARTYPNVARHYGAAWDAPHIQANAEFLPIADLTFDTVHMRSCLDHFASPRLALLEAYRVLRPGGSVVIGITLEGAYERKTYSGSKLAATPGPYRRLVEMLRPHPFAFRMARKLRLWRGGHDVHLWHPTYDSLHQLLDATGFSVERDVWMKSHYNGLFVRAVKQDRRVDR